MKSLLIFHISESQSIQIIIDENDKVNIYGYETDDLHVFDEVEVRYIDGEQEVVLAKDIVREIVSVFSASLEKSLKNKLSLDKSLAIGKVSQKYSYLFDDMDSIFTKYSVWSSPESKIHTWLYNRDNKIYLEISPIYPWLYQTPQFDEHINNDKPIVIVALPNDTISFDEYMNNYKPIAVVELQEQRVQTWIDQCDTLLQKIETVFNN